MRKRINYYMNFQQHRNRIYLRIQNRKACTVKHVKFNVYGISLSCHVHVESKIIFFRQSVSPTTCSNHLGLSASDIKHVIINCYTSSFYCSQTLPLLFLLVSIYSDMSFMLCEEGKLCKL